MSSESLQLNLHSLSLVYTGLISNSLKPIHTIFVVKAILETWGFVINVDALPEA